MMSHFPKKYKQKDIRALNARYQSEYPEHSDSCALFSLSAIQPLHIGHVYALFLRDFLLKSGKFAAIPTIVFAPKFLLSLYYAFSFFSKKRQSLHQVGRHKVSLYLLSQIKKKKKANQAFLQANFGEKFDIAFYDEEFYAFVYQTFFSLWESGLVRFVPNLAYWSVDLQTTIPLEYISFQQEQCKRYTIKYFIETKNDILPVCAISVDEIFGDVALLVHPQDKRYKKLIGKRAIVPVVNKLIPIIGDTRVDISKNNGIKRVNPTSDFESIALAQEYHLPLDHYIVDQYGNYTQYAGEYCGKSRKDFYGNVLQFLEDITNLSSACEDTHLVPYCTFSGEKLLPALASELVLDVASFKNVFLEKFAESPFAEIEHLQKYLYLFDRPYFVLSRPSLFGLTLPLLHSGSLKLSFVDFFRDLAYADSSQECFDVLLLYFATGNVLMPVFDVKKLTVLFSHTSEQLSLFFSVLKYFSPHLVDSFSEMITLIQSKDEQQLEKYCERFLETSRVVKRGELGYSLYLEHQGKPYEISGEALDDGFLEALYAIYVAQQHPLCPMKCLEQGKEILFFQELLLQHLLLQRFLYSSLIISPSFLDKKGERYSYRSLALSAETLLFEEYGESSVKLSLLLKSSLSSDSVYFYDYVLRQLWNGVRYCSQQYSADFTMESAFQVFEKQADELDIWLIGELATLYLEFTNLLNYQAILRHFYYFQYFVQRKLLGWYVEIKKEMSGGATDAVLFIVYAFVFGYLFQFVPEYVRALMQASPYKIFSFEGILFSNERSTHMIQLFNLFDTIYTFKMKLGIKKHQSISLFLKTDPNSLQVFRKYQPVFQQVLHIKDIVFVRLHEPDPRGYDQEIFEGITIGIKPAPEGNCSGEMTLAELEFSYAKKLEYLEYLRSLLTSPSIEPESLSDKQKEVEQTKVELDTLYIKIQKLKMRR